MNEEFTGNPLKGTFRDDVSTQNYWSAGDINQLSYTHTYVVCKATHETLFKLNGGDWVQSTTGSVTFSPVQDSLSHQFFGSQTISDFRVVTKIGCDYPSWVDSLSVTGDVRILPYTVSSSGYDQQLSTLQDSTTVFITPLSSNGNYVITSVHDFTADQFENVASVINGETTLGVTVMHDLDFRITSAGVTTNLDATSTFQSKNALKLNVNDDGLVDNSNLPNASTKYATMTLDSIKETLCLLGQTCSDGANLIGGSLDTSGDDTHQVAIRGILQDYDTREASPQVLIQQPNGVQYQKVTMQFEKMVNTDDAQFKAIVFMKRDSMNGVWTVTMLQDNWRQSSQKVFSVLNSVVDTNPISNPSSPTVFQAETGIGYTHIWNPIIDGVTATAVIDTGILDRQTLSSGIPQLDIINDKDFQNNCETKPFGSEDINKECGSTLLAGSKQLREIKLYPLILPATPEEAFTIQYVKSSTIKAVVSIEIDGKTKEIGTYNVISDPVSSASSIQCGASTIDGSVDANKCLAFTRGISLGRALIPADPDVELKVFALGLDKEKPYPMIMKASLSGSFELLAKDGVVFKGTLPQLDYAWSAIYQDPSYSGGSKCNSSDKSACVDACPDGTTPVVNVNTGLVECQDETCNLLSSCDLPVNDSDNDGIPDDLDSCPSLFGTKERNGCPDSVEPKDSDGDGVPDAKDVCPSLFGLAENDGCPVDAPQVDTDGDGVPDKIDQCPNVKGLKDNYGCPTLDKTPDCPTGQVLATSGECVNITIVIGLDSDGDTVEDKFDQCPNTPANTEVDVNGCSINQDPSNPKCGTGTILDGITNSCVPKTPTIVSPPSVCFDVTTGEQIECPFNLDDETILYIAVGIFAVGIIAVIVKRRG